MDLGDFEGMSATHWAQNYPEFKRKWETGPAALAMPEGESLEQVQERAVRVLKRICNKHSAESTIVVCSHNFVISCLLCHASRTPLNGFREMRQDTGAISIIVKEENQFEVQSVNSCKHLVHGD